MNLQHWIVGAIGLIVVFLLIRGVVRLFRNPGSACSTCERECPHRKRGRQTIRRTGEVR